MTLSRIVCYDDDVMTSDDDDVLRDGGEARGATWSGTGNNLNQNMVEMCSNHYTPSDCGDGPTT